MLLVAAACILVAVLATGCGGGTDTSASTSQATNTVEPTTTTATTPTTPPLVLAIQRLLAGQVTVGHIAWNHPARLRVHEQSEIEVILSLKESVAKLKTKLNAFGRKEGAKIRVASVMEADLSGDDFEIAREGTARRLINTTGETRWGWLIEPTSTGLHYVDLNLTAFLNVKDPAHPRALYAADEPYEVGQFTRRLDIESVPQSSTHRVSEFAGRNWQWFVTTIVALLGVYGFHRRKKPPADEVAASKTDLKR